MKSQSRSDLTSKKCLPCEGGVDACSLNFAEAQLKELPGWTLSEDGKLISRKWTLRHFAAGMQLLQIAAEIAEQEQHHPDLHLTGYRHVRIDLTTHAIGGLSENDFIVAAKIDAATSSLD